MFKFVKGTFAFGQVVTSGSLGQKLSEKVSSHTTFKEDKKNRASDDGLINL